MSRPKAVQRLTVILPFDRFYFQHNLLIILWILILWINNRNTNKVWAVLSTLSYVGMLSDVSILDWPVWTTVCLCFLFKPSYFIKWYKACVSVSVQVRNDPSPLCFHLSVAIMWLFPAAQWRPVQICWFFRRLSLLVPTPRLDWSTGKLHKHTG